MQGVSPLAQTRPEVATQAARRFATSPASVAAMLGLAILAFLVLAMLVITAMQLRPTTPSPGMSVDASGRIMALDVDGAAALSGLRLGDRIVAVDGAPLSARAISAMRQVAHGDFTAVSTGGIGSFGYFYIGSMPASRTAIAGDIAALATVLLLWLGGAIVASVRRRDGVARLYALAAFACALALAALVGRQVGLSWVWPAFALASPLALSALAVANVAIGRDLGRHSRLIVWLACGAELAVIVIALLLHGQASSLLLMALLALLSFVALLGPTVAALRTPVARRRARLRIAACATLLGLLPLWIWPGATAFAALEGASYSISGQAHISSLWAFVALVPAATLWAALGLRWGLPRLSTATMVALGYLPYLAPAAAIGAVWFMVLPAVSGAGRAVLITAGLVLFPALQRGLSAWQAHLSHANAPAFDAAVQLVMRCAEQPGTPETLAAEVAQHLPALLRVRSATIFVRDPTLPGMRLRQAGAAETIIHEAPAEVATMPRPFWMATPDDLNVPILWAPLRSDGETQGALALVPYDPEAVDDLDRDRLDKLAITLALAMHTRILAVNLHERTGALVALTHRLSHAHEQERANLSRELHDVVAQELIALTRHLRRYGEGNAAPAAIWADMLAGAQDALVATRRICNGLRPAILDLGITPALRDLVSAADAEATSEVSLTVDGTEYRTNADLEFALFRVAQEGLSNALHHARAHQIRIEMSFADGLTLRVRDDGRGFAVPLRFEDLPGDHLGLIGMRERIAEFGGTLTVSSAPGRGAVLEARIPAPKA